jgi:hypothetical protein
MLKLATPYITEPLTYIINLSILQERFPNKWKLGRVLPLSKGKDTYLPKGYRPVCLLPAASKVLEMVIVSQVTSYMIRSQQLNQNQHAYRSNHSTCTALLQLSDQWLEAVNGDEQTASMLLDMSAAFDCVDPGLLDKKLDLYNFNRGARTWIRSYLGSRSQQVTLGGQVSEFLPVPVGVPQGSCLGPILYIIFTNEIPEIPKDHQNCRDRSHSERMGKLFGKNCQTCGTITCYADDSTYCISSKKTEKLQGKLTETLNKISSFLKANKLQLNDDKTVLMRMTTIQQHTWNPQETLKIVAENKKVVEPVEETRLLGAILRNDMSWRTNVISGKDAILKQVNRKTGILRGVRKYLTKKSMLTLANGILISRLVYLIPVWGGTTVEITRRLQASQNSAARMILGRGKRTRVTTLLKECNWLSVRQLTMLHSLVQLWKTVKTGCPGHFGGRLRGETEEGRTRRNVTRGRLDSRSRSGKKIVRTSWRWRAVDQWNTLPESLRTQNSMTVFKKELKKWISLNIPIT